MNQPVITIGILVEKEITFDLYGEFTSTVLASRMSGSYKAHLSGNKITLIKEGMRVAESDSILIVPNDYLTDSFLIKDVVIGKNFHWEKKINQRFRGSIKLIIEAGKICVINILYVEDYLVSVISSEMSSNSSIEMLKAHAIISRSWLIAQLDKRLEARTIIEYQFRQKENELIKWYDREDHENYDLCADDHCQRYQGIARIVNDAALHAIDKTRGIVLMFNDKVCDTRYSKCCGGISESYENVWEPVVHPYLTSIIDYKYVADDFETDLDKEENANKWIKNKPLAFCNTTNKKVLSQVLVDFDQATTDFYRWKVEFTQEEISSLIKEKSGIDFGNILDLVPVERGNSGRIIKLKIVGDKKTLIIGKELEIRRVLSKSHLYSSAFLVKKEEVKDSIPGKFILQGAGWGHGVGLCQIGAAVMGDMGYKFDEILSHYFNDANLKKIY
ncbi:amidase [bacterium BRH_c32]|nr:MAG: amidase [bacterium BRH_c32]